ncbi:MAG TPA: TIM barrel protein [Anaerolineaceae bacterium]
MNRLAINVLHSELEAATAFCRQQNLGIELTDFAFPASLDGSVEALAERCAHHRALTAGVQPVSSHGPFMDLIVTSRDPAIVEVCRKRHGAGLEASHRSGASLYIAHTNFTPLIRNASYQANFCKRTVDFWLPFADWAAERGMVICLENLWEQTPEVQAEIVTLANHPSLKASFDNGHALVFSDVPASEWIYTLGKGLAHLHLHDNNGAEDEHKPAGQGKENWQSLLLAAQAAAPGSLLVLESDHLVKNQESLQHLRKVLL